MTNISPDIARQIQAAMQRPVGTAEFQYINPEAFGLGNKAGVLIQIVAGGHIFRLERSADRVLSFFYSSPGTGTRVASITLGAVPPFNSALLFFIWSPEEIRFLCGPLVENGSLLSGEGTISSKQLRVGDDGSIFTVGDTGVEVIGARVVERGRPILQPTAIDAWNATLKGIEVLRTAKSTEGFLFESVLASVTVVHLVTGMEAYASTRFWEIETEGIRPNVAALLSKFVSKHQLDGGFLDELKAESHQKRISVLRLIVSKRLINFQNYVHLKRAFSSAYGLTVSDIGLTSARITRLKTFVKYRHLIVHVSPLVGMLNASNVPPEQPEIASNALATEAIACFEEFVRALHKASLSLRPTT